MVHAYQKGKLKNAPEEVKEIARSISSEDAEHFAKTKHKGLPEKKAYMHGFMDKCAEYGMTKEAKNILKLLSRIGTDLSGATARDLKFLSRRGLKGLTKDQVKALMGKGMLPSTERVFSGNVKGTMNMFQNPLGKAKASNSLFKAPTRLRETVKYDPLENLADIEKRYAIIPKQTKLPGESLDTTISRLVSARHEAREMVRGSAAANRLSNATVRNAVTRDLVTVTRGGKGVSRDLVPIEAPTMSRRVLEGLEGTRSARELVGSSHWPGVLHDERVFYSQLANRLGLGQAWATMPMGRYYRGLRDIAVGQKPLSFDFKIHNTANRLLKARNRYFNNVPDWSQLARESGVSSRDLSDFLSINKLSPEGRLSLI